MADDLLTPAQAERNIRLVMNELEKKSKLFEDFAMTAARAEHAYRMAHAKARIVAEGSDAAARDAASLLAVQDEHEARMLTAAARDGCQERIRALRDELHGATSLNVNVRRAAGLSQ